MDSQTLNILNERLARGEIDPAEYQQLVRLLKENDKPLYMASGSASVEEARTSGRQPAYQPISSGQRKAHRPAMDPSSSKSSATDLSRKLITALVIVTILMIGGIGAIAGWKRLSLRNTASATVSMSHDGNTIHVEKSEEKAVTGFPAEIQMEPVITGMQSNGTDLGHYLAMGSQAAIVTGNNYPENGIVYIYNHRTGNLMRSVKPPIADMSSFGSAIAAEGAVAVVGGGQEGKGDHAFLVNLNSGRTTELLSPDSASGDYFGMTAIAISKDKTIVSAPHWGGDARGRAYVFAVPTCELVTTLKSDDNDPGKFGSAVAVWGNRAVVSSTFSQAASAYVFDTTSGEKMFRLTPGPIESGLSKVAVAIDEDYIVLAEMENRLTWIFDAHTGLQIGSFNTPDNAKWGTEAMEPVVRIHGHYGLINTPKENTGMGGAYIFDLVSGQVVSHITPKQPVVDMAFGSTADWYWAEDNSVTIWIAALGEKPFPKVYGCTLNGVPK